MPRIPRARRRLATFLVVLCLAGCATTPSAPSSDVARLTQQSHAWDRAIVAKDRAAIEANMAEDFRQIDGRANVETKQSFVDDVMSPQLQIDPYAVEDFEVRWYGDVALLSGRTRMTGRYDDRPFATHYRYLDVYVRRDGVWRVTHVQVTNLPQ